MAFNAAGVITALQTMLAAISGMQTVYVGVPESLGTRVTAYVAFVGDTGPAADKVTGVLQDERAWFVGFGYRVSGAEASAETTLCAFVDAFTRAFYADRTLGGLIQGQTRLDFSLARDPRYAVFSGQEFRVLPVLVIGSQRETYNQNQ